MVTTAEIEHALRRIADPVSGQDVLTAKRVQGLVCKDGNVGFMIVVTAEERTLGEALALDCARVLEAIAGVRKVTPVVTAEVAAGMAGSQGTPPPLFTVEGWGPHDKSEAAPAPLLTSPRERGEGTSRHPALWKSEPVEGVDRIIAIASGKGGVGKSTVAVGLARAAAARGIPTALLDADIYGPSLPRMMGLLGHQPQVEGGKFVPLQSDGVACMSAGFLLGKDAAILRGPMVSKTLLQLLRGTRWGTSRTLLSGNPTGKESLKVTDHRMIESSDALLATLFIDFPPGTGDVQLSLAQQTPLGANGGGAIMVTTPQEVALDDARKAAIMFQKIGVPILGVIENMSFLQDASGTMLYPFGQGGGARLAQEFSVPLLGRIPLLPELQQALDQGKGVHVPEFEKIVTGLFGMD